jgi:hypothetical protein
MKHTHKLKIITWSRFTLFVGVFVISPYLIPSLIFIISNNLQKYFVCPMKITRIFISNEDYKILCIQNDDNSDTFVFKVTTLRWLIPHAYRVVSRRRTLEKTSKKQVDKMFASWEPLVSETVAKCWFILIVLQLLQKFRNVTTMERDNNYCTNTKN